MARGVLTLVRDDKDRIHTLVYFISPPVLLVLPASW